MAKNPIPGNTLNLGKAAEPALTEGQKTTIDALAATTTTPLPETAVEKPSPEAVAKAVNRKLYISTKPSFKVLVTVRRQREQLLTSVTEGQRIHTFEEDRTESVQFENCVLYLDDTDPALLKGFEKALKNGHVRRFCRPIQKEHEAQELRMLQMRRGIMPQSFTGTATTDQFADNLRARAEQVAAGQEAGIGPGDLTDMNLRGGPSASGL